MKVHITLLGGQTYPAFLGIADDVPEKCFLFHSSATKANALAVYRESHKLFPEIDFNYVVLDPVDWTACRNPIERVSETLGEDDKVTVNISGGTKIWSILFYEIFKDKARIIYVDQNSRIHELFEKEENTYFSAVKIDTNTVFGLNNNNPVRSTSYSDYDEADFKVLDKVRKLRAKSTSHFNALTLPSHSEITNSRTGAIEHKGSRVSWDKNVPTVDFCISLRNTVWSEHLSSPHVHSIVFNSGWFELYVAQLLSGWSHTEDIDLNLVFAYRNDENKLAKGKAKNEIDIVVNLGNRLLFVECKTQIFNKTDLDKFNSDVKKYVGTGCLALFVTYEEMDENTKEKCRDNNIIPFSIKEHNDPASALYRLLDKNYEKINHK